MLNQFNLDGLVMNAVQTASNGVVGPDTIFRFSQQSSDVSANYSGGRIERGFLVGQLAGDKLTFQFYQLETDGRIDCGRSRCEIKQSPEGLIEIIEYFEWTSGHGSGMNIIREIPQSSNAIARH